MFAGAPVPPGLEERPPVLTAEEAKEAQEAQEESEDPNRPSKGSPESLQVIKVDDQEDGGTSFLKLFPAHRHGVTQIGTDLATIGRDRNSCSTAVGARNLHLIFIIGLLTSPLTRSVALPATW